MPPPKKKKQPTNLEKAEILESLSEAMVQARKFLSDSNGKVTMRRMSKDAYVNAIYDLLGVKVDALKLPRDRYEDSYDTHGDSLYFSPSQLTEYQAIAQDAFARLLAEDFKPTTIRVNPKGTCRQKADKVD